MMRPGARLATSFLMAFVVAVVAVGPVGAAEPTFDRPTVDATFGEGIVFRQSFESPVALDRVEILLEYPDSLGPFVVEVAGATAAGRRTLEYRYALGEDGHLVPNTPIAARWRLVPADRTVPEATGPAVDVLYEDTRFDWRTLSGALVRLHWYEGSDGFGRRALAIGEKAVKEASEFMGVTESEPVDFFVYADEAAFYDAVGPTTRENVVGTAHADIRTMFALIGPDDIGGSGVRRIVPHELTHLVFDTAVSNPYHSPPRWLNEGVATYLSEGYTASDRRAVEAAAGDGRLMPLRALGGLFPTTYERFSLAYAESTSAIDFLVREKGTDALVALINSYADGVTDDEAFLAAVGRDLAGFERAWLDDLGAEVPVEHGPQPAPAGPVPNGWDASSSPAPETEPGAATPAPAAAPASPADGSDSGSPFGDPLILVLVAGAGLAIGGTLAYARRRSRQPAPPA